MLAVEKIVKLLSRRFRFGYHEVEDMCQTARAMAYDGLSRYDGKRNLEGFLYTHVRNRLTNYKRDTCQRTDCPCRACERGEYVRCPAGGRRSCEAYEKWAGTNGRKRQLVSGSSASRADRFDHRPGVDRLVADRELMEYVDARLTVDERRIYLKVRDGLRVSSAEKKVLAEALRGYVDG